MFRQRGVLPQAAPWNHGLQPCRNQTACDKVAEKDASCRSRMFATGSLARRRLLLHKGSNCFRTQQGPFRYSGSKGKGEELPSEVKIFAPRTSRNSGGALQILIIFGERLFAGSGCGDRMGWGNDVLLS